MDIPVDGPVPVHDMSLTANYAVIYDLPVLFSPEAIAEGSLFPYRWSEEYESRVGLLPLEGATVVHLPVRVPYGFRGNWAPDDS